jgi:predicted dinucleotide-binding enzyme
MRVAILGSGGLVNSLTALSTRAGHAVLRIDAYALDPASCALSDLLIVAGERPTLTDLIARVSPALRADVVVVDATVPVGDQQSHRSGDVISEDEWQPFSPTTQIVRAFASVPAEAFSRLADHSAGRDASDLAVPMAGDDVSAKATVGKFMQQIGVSPIDLGPLAVAYVMEPGGPLWGKAVDELDMQECIGWLSGDG